jgi:hypothetical protein
VVETIDQRKTWSRNKLGEESCGVSRGRYSLEGDEKRRLKGSRQGGGVDGGSLEVVSDQ